MQYYVIYHFFLTDSSMHVFMQYLWRDHSNGHPLTGDYCAVSETPYTIHICTQTIPLTSARPSRFVYLPVYKYCSYWADVCKGANYYRFFALQNVGIDLQAHSEHSFCIGAATPTAAYSMSNIHDSSWL